MITIRARLVDGAEPVSSIEVTGHGRQHPGDTTGAALCSTSSTAIETVIAYLAAVAEQYPEHMEFHLTKE